MVRSSFVHACRYIVVSIILLGAWAGGSIFVISEFFSPVNIIATALLGYQEQEAWDSLTSEIPSFIVRVLILDLRNLLVLTFPVQVGLEALHCKWNGV